MSSPIRLSAGLSGRLTALLHGEFRNVNQGSLRDLILHFRTHEDGSTTINSIELEAQSIIDAAVQENPQEAQGITQRLNPLLSAIRNYQSLNIGLTASEGLQRQLSQVQAGDPAYNVITSSIGVQATVNQDNAARAEESTQALLEIEQLLLPLTPPSSPSAQRRVVPEQPGPSQPPPRGLPLEFFHIDTSAPIPILGPEDQMEPQWGNQIRAWLGNNLTDDGYFCMPITESRQQLETVLDFFNLTIRTGAAQVQATGLRSFEQLLDHANDVSSGLNVASAALSTSFEGSVALSQELVALLDRPLGSFTNQAGAQESITFRDLFPVNRTEPLTDHAFYQYYYRVVTEAGFAAQNNNGANARAIIAEIFITLRQVSDRLGGILRAYQDYIDGLDESMLQASWYTPPRRDDDPGADPDAPAPAAVVTESTAETEQKVHTGSADKSRSDSDEEVAAEARSRQDASASSSSSSSDSSDSSDVEEKKQEAPSKTAEQAPREERRHSSSPTSDGEMSLPTRRVPQRQTEVEETREKVLLKRSVRDARSGRTSASADSDSSDEEVTTKKTAKSTAVSSASSSSIEEEVTTSKPMRSASPPPTQPRVEEEKKSTPATKPEPVSQEVKASSSSSDTEQEAEQKPVESAPSSVYPTQQEAKASSSSSDTEEEEKPVESAPSSVHPTQQEAKASSSSSDTEEDEKPVKSALSSVHPTQQEAKASSSSSGTDDDAPEGPGAPVRDPVVPPQDQAPNYFPPPRPRPFDSQSEGRRGNPFSRFFRGFRSGLGSRSRSEPDLRGAGREQPQFEEQEEFDWTQQTQQSSDTKPSQPGAEKRKGLRGSTHFPFIKWGVSKKAPKGPTGPAPTDQVPTRPSRPAPAPPTGPSDPRPPAGPSGVQEPSDYASRNIGPYRPWDGTPLEDLTPEFDINRRWILRDGQNVSLAERRAAALDPGLSVDARAAARAKYITAIAEISAAQRQLKETEGKFGREHPTRFGDSLAAEDRYRYGNVKAPQHTLVLQNPALQPGNITQELISNPDAYQEALNADPYYRLRMNHMVAGGAVVGRMFSAPRIESLGSWYDYLYDSGTTGVHVLMQDSDFIIESNQTVPMVNYFNPVAARGSREHRVIMPGEQDTRGYPTGTLFIPQTGIQTPTGIMSVQSRLVAEHFDDLLATPEEEVAGAEAAQGVHRTSWTRQYELILTRNGQSRIIKILQTAGWREMQGIEPQEIGGLLSLRRNVFGADNLSNVVTHSGAGIGRSGTLLTAEASVNLGLPVLTVLSDLRSSRIRLTVESDSQSQSLFAWAMERGLPILPDEPSGPLADQHGNFAPAPAPSLSPDQLPPGQRRPSFVAQQPQAQPQPQEESETEDEA